MLYMHDSHFESNYTVPQLLPGVTSSSTELGVTPTFYSVSTIPKIRTEMFQWGFIKYITEKIYSTVQRLSF